MGHCNNSCTFCYQPCTSCSCCTSCESCRSCNCHECSNSTENCGCLYPSNTDCVSLKGIDSSCITGLVSGISLTEAINLQNAAICNSVVNPSGYISSVSSCNSNILITLTNPSGITTTDYQVCLNPALVTQINNNTSAIATLTTCTSGLVGDITTGTPLYLTITNTGADSPCGRVYNINYNPSGNTNYDGIVCNQCSGSISSGTGTQILGIFNRNYVAQSNITNGDQIRFVCEGSVSSPSAPPGSVIFELFDANTATIVYSITESTLSQSAGAYSFELHGVINKLSPTSTTVSIYFNTSAQPNGNYGGFYSPMRGVIRKTLTSLDYTNLSLRLKVNITDASATIDSGISLVEVRKKI